MSAVNSFETPPPAVSPSIDPTNHSAVKPVTTVTSNRSAKAARILSFGSFSSAESVLMDEEPSELEEPPHREGNEGILNTPPSVGGWGPSMYARAGGGGGSSGP